MTIAFTGAELQTQVPDDRPVDANEPLFGNTWAFIAADPDSQQGIFLRVKWHGAVGRGQHLVGLFGGGNGQRFETYSSVPLASDLVEFSIDVPWKRCTARSASLNFEVTFEARHAPVMMDYRQDRIFDKRDLRGGYAGVNAKGHIGGRPFKGCGFRDRNAALRPGRASGRHLSFCLSSLDHDATAYGLILQPVDASFADSPKHYSGFIQHCAQLKELTTNEVSVLRPHTGIATGFRTADVRFDIERVLGEIQLCTEWDPLDPDPLEAREGRTYYSTRFRTLVARSETFGLCAGYFEEASLATF